MVFPEDEYLAIKNNFTDTYYLKQLVQNITFKDTYLQVTWLEGQTDNVYVDVEGWYVGNSNDKYPTFESMGMRRSELFNKKWADMLWSKLKEVEEEDASKEAIITG